MDRISQNRIFVLRALSRALTETAQLPSVSDSEFLALREIVLSIKRDDKGHFLSSASDLTSTNITYARCKEYIFEQRMRWMTPICGYCAKHYPEQFRKISESCLFVFVRKFQSNLNKIAEDFNIKQI